MPLREREGESQRDRESVVHVVSGTCIHTHTHTQRTECVQTIHCVLYLLVLPPLSHVTNRRGTHPQRGQRVRSLRQRHRPVPSL